MLLFLLLALLFTTPTAPDCIGDLRHDGRRSGSEKLRGMFAPCLVELFANPLPGRWGEQYLRYPFKAYFFNERTGLVARGEGAEKLSDASVSMLPSLIMLFPWPL